MGEPADPASRTRAGSAARSYLWLLGWMIFLVSPALTLPELDPAAPAAGGLVAFAGTFLVVMRSCWDVPLRASRSGAAQLAGLGVLAALGVGLATGYSGADESWLLVLVYVGAAGAAMLPAPGPARYWLAGTVVVQLAIGAGQGVPVAGSLVLALVTVLVGALNLSLRRIQDLVTHLRRTQAELAETAVRDERLRFSRDLHDLLGHTLSLIVVKAELIRRSAGPDQPVVAREAAEVEQVGRRALAEVREAVSGYRERAFATELDAARNALAGAGLRVTVWTSGTPLPAPADSLLGWAVREAATNVVRHSGARHCQIEVRRADGSATLEVRDDGAGGQRQVSQDGPARPGGPAGPGGLAGLAERLAEAGGTLAAGRAPDGGWRLSATVPVSRP